MELFRYTWRTFARELLLLAGAVVFAVPVYLLVVMSLKNQTEVFKTPLSLPHHAIGTNFSEAWDGTAGGTGMQHAFLTSAIITFCSVVLLITIGSLCAYTLARRRSRLSTGLYVLVVLGIVLPFQLEIVPLYVALHHLGLSGSIVGMILLYTGMLMPLTVFLYTGFVRSLPRDYEEAAAVDGASFRRTFTRVILPLLRPITGTVAILTGILIWNDFFASFIFLSGSSHETLPVALYSFVGEYTSRWNVIFAAVIISIAPMLLFFVVAQRQLIRGFAGGIRG